jgi:hypothetical protein
MGLRDVRARGGGGTCRSGATYHKDKGYNNQKATPKHGKPLTNLIRKNNTYIQTLKFGEIEFIGKYSTYLKYRSSILISYWSIVATSSLRGCGWSKINFSFPVVPLIHDFPSPFQGCV